jgi:hypothetical protein
LLPWFRAHIDVIGAAGDIFDPTYFFGDRFDIDGPGNIDSTMTDKDSQSAHGTSQNSIGLFLSFIRQWNFGMME